MGKLRQWFRKWFDRQVEKSLQRQADRLFMRGKKNDSENIQSR
tara:strand:- start:580 stop:708 length:129 start_codon:yes stop_codon:yes gene_type:complete